MSSAERSADWEILEAIGDHRAGFRTRISQSLQYLMRPLRRQTGEMAKRSHGFWHRGGKPGVFWDPCGTSSGGHFPLPQGGAKIALVPFDLIPRRLGG